MTDCWFVAIDQPVGAPASPRSRPGVPTLPHSPPRSPLSPNSRPIPAVSSHFRASRCLPQVERGDSLIGRARGFLNVENCAQGSSVKKKVKLDDHVSIVPGKWDKAARCHGQQPNPRPRSCKASVPGRRTMVACLCRSPGA